ncbi:MAG: tail fiber domain-containing protein [bacterium]|nr:tail fiber domain-containing protein [bacterium]
MRRNGTALGSSSGFTLIELIIYIGIFSIAAGLFTGVLTTLTKVQVRESATIEVSGQAQFIIQTIQRLISDASLIELTKDAATSTLKLRMSVTANDPTCIQLSNGYAYLMQGDSGGGSCYATSTAQAKLLTTSKVVVNTLTFTKFENPPAGDTVKVDLTVSYNSTNPQESIISRTLQTAIAKISAATFDNNIIPSADTSYDVGVSANRWRNGLFSTSLIVGYTSMSNGVAAFNGNVGIGTAQPVYALDVSGGLRAGNATSTFGLMFNPGTGNVGIGTATPGTHALSVVGTAGLSTGTAWTNTSDWRWKNVRDELKGSSLDKILALRPISYTWNDLHNSQFGESPGLKYGFIAQEVKKVIPEMVSRDDKGYYWYNPSGIEAILTAAMQEQEEVIKAQRLEIDDLKVRLDRLEGGL